MIRPGEFGELTAFAAVAEARSFRRAAEAIKLRPSTLSHAVRALEERLGVRLALAGCIMLAALMPLVTTPVAIATLHRARTRSKALRAGGQL